MTIHELLTCQEVMQLTGIRSRTTIWRRIQRGSFPAPLDFGAGRLRWKSEEISDWLNSLPKRRY